MRLTAAIRNLFHNSLIRHLAIFLLIGLCAHTLFEMSEKDTSGNLGKITLNSQEINDLRAIFIKQHQQQPTKKELERLIADKVNEKLLIAEGIRHELYLTDKVVKLRLTKNIAFLEKQVNSRQNQNWLTAMIESDLVIKRRMLQQMETLIGSEGSKITEADLHRYYQDHSEQYRTHPKYHISHQYLAFTPNDSIPRSFTGPSQPLSRSNLEKILPKKLVAEMVSAQPGQVLVLKTKYGEHRVKVEQIIPGEIPPLSQVRAQVYQGFLLSRQQRLTADYLKSIKPYYQVAIAKVRDPV